VAQVGVRTAVLAVALAAVGLGTGAAWADAIPNPFAPTSTTQPTTTTTSTTSTTTTSTTVAPSGADVFNPTVGVIPPEAQALIDQFHPSPPGSTVALLAALAPLRAMGISPTVLPANGFGRFPVAGKAIWSDDFMDPRFTVDGTFGFHHATDIPSPCGTPVQAPDDGTMTQGSDPGGGTTITITEPDGTYLYLAHLAGYAPGTRSGEAVRVGALIGFVGQTGAATGCHLHIEIHPQGGQPVDPKPFLDAWYADALAGAPLLVQALGADRALPLTSGRSPEHGKQA
jgi:murein DD-endopeptidase MepM/ murein hydrolase activator NlpD